METTPDEIKWFKANLYLKFSKLFSDVSSKVSEKKYPNPRIRPMALKVNHVKVIIFKLTVLFDRNF